MAVNKVILIGNVGREPEIRSTTSGAEVASFSLATTDYWKDKNSGERREKTEWHNIVIYAPGIVNVVKNYVHKGSKIYLEGALQTRRWTDKNNTERYITEVVLQGYSVSLQLLDPRQGGGMSNANSNFAGSNASHGGTNENSLDEPDFVTDNNVEHGDDDGEGGSSIDDDIPF